LAEATSGTGKDVQKQK